MVRVALLSDTHGMLDPQVGATLHGCDYAVHAGDVGNGAVLEALRRCGGQVIAVRGNNDTPGKWPSGEQEILEQLPDEATLELPGGRLAVVHGDRVNPASQRHARLRRRYADARLVVYGHSHRLVCDRRSLPWVVNPGAAGNSRTFGGPSLLLLTVAEGIWELESLRFPRS